MDQHATDSAATPAFIASLIESAVTFFEIDLEASRDYLFRACTLLRAQVKRPHDPPPDAARGRLAAWQAKRILAFIEENLTTRIQTEDLAGIAGLSIGHFFRAFKVSVGTTPCEYIARRRVELACEKMRTTGEPLARIALECGFNDQSNFCRVFRRVVGQSPNVWRRANSTGPVAAAFAAELR